jgi:hypothetical protein
MGVRDRELHAGQATGDQPPHEGQPARAVLARHDLEPEHLPLPLRVDAHRDERCHVHGAPALAAPQRHGVEPHVRVRPAVQRPLAETRDQTVQALRQLRHLGLREPRDAERLHQVLHLAGRDPEHVALRHHRHECALRPPPRLEQPAREVRALAQLRERQVNRPEPRVPRPRPIPVARVDAVGTALAVPRAAQPVDLQGHQLRHRLRENLPQHIRRRGLQQLVQRLNSRHPLLGHHVLSSVLHWAMKSGEGAVMAFVYPATATGPRTPRRRTLTTNLRGDRRTVRLTGR